MADSKISSNRHLTNIHRGDDFSIGFSGYFQEREKINISSFLNNRDQKASLSSATYRQLNSWEEHGLLTINREGSEWRKFSVMDSIWVKIIQELRRFGLSIEKIKLAKESLSYLSEECGVPMPLLEFYIAFAIAKRMPIVLLVFEDGIAIPASYEQYRITKELFGMENHLQIDLNELVQGLFTKDIASAIYEFDLSNSPEEVELIDFIRSKQFKKVDVFFKNGKMDFLEGREKISEKERLADVLRKQSHSSLEIEQRNNKIVSIHQKTIKNIKKR